MCGGLKDSFSSTLVYRLTSFTLHTLTSTNTHTQHRALDSVGWGAALLAVRLLFGTLSPVLFMLGEPVSGWFGFGLPFSATVRSPCLWGFASSVWCLVVMEMRGSGGSGVPEPRGGLQMVSWVSLHLPLAPGGFFLFSQLFISPSLSSKFHDTHSTQDCWFVYLCFCCFLFQLLCFSLLVFCILFLRAAPVGDPSWFSSWALSYWSHVFFYFLLFSSLSAFLYYTCAHILWILMEMNK